jgi:hypothetical protein
MSTTSAPDPHQIVTDAGHRALAVLRTPEADQLEAVAWASAHLAAVTRTLLPLTSRTLPDAADEITSVRRAAAHLQVHLRRLEQLHSGDGLVSRVDDIAVHDSARDDLEHYLVLESDLLRRLFAELGPEASMAAAAAYEKHLGSAPTRPHPHTPQRGALGVVAFWVDAFRDRVMDTMDGRHVPVPRPRRAVREPGRWGQYLLGGAVHR